MSAKKAMRTEKVRVDKYKKHEEEKEVDWVRLRQIEMDRARERAAIASAIEILNRDTMQDDHLSLCRTSGYLAFEADVIDCLKKRFYIRSYDDEGVDVTPKFLNVNAFIKKFRALVDELNVSPLFMESSEPISHSHQSGPMMSKLHSNVHRIGLRTSFEEVMRAIGSVRFSLGTAPVPQAIEAAPVEVKEIPFIKVTLKRTRSKLLFINNSSTVNKFSELGPAVDADNKQYDYLTIGKGKIRRRNDAETQTPFALQKDRWVNTEPKPTADQSSFISTFEVFDTYRNIKEAELAKTQKVAIDCSEETQAKIEKDTPGTLKYIANLPSWKIQSMLMMRVLSVSGYGGSQQRFRTFVPPDPLVEKVDYLYECKVIFCFPPQTHSKIRRGVADISFCYGNGDILAAAYGIYSFVGMSIPPSGYVAVWSIKSPLNPERIYRYKSPVVSVEFSRYIPKLLAIGLYNGYIEVRDVSNRDDPPIAIAEHIPMNGCDPVVCIRWFKQSNEGEATDIDPFIALSQGGKVNRFSIVPRSSVLASFPQMTLQRVEGNPEGLQVSTSHGSQQQANRHPQGIHMTMHPQHQDIYYILTDEGCVHKCSTNYSHQYLEVLRTHNGAVLSMEFSPWSPKVFLTTGNDWYIRVWIQGVYKPVLTLKNKFIPVYAAYWSKTHATIIIAITRKTVDIWDVRTNVLRPMSSTELGTSFNTSSRLSRCGSTIAIGNEKGNVNIVAFDKFPFAPHFQFEALQDAIWKANETDIDVLTEIKNIGYYGYPEGKAIHS